MRFYRARAAEILSNKNHKEQVIGKNLEKKEEKQPVIPDFTAQSGINANVNEETDTVDLLDLFLDDEFFKLFVDQAITLLSILQHTLNYLCILELENG